MMFPITYWKATGFNPLDLNPFIWLDAANGVTESSGLVSSWADQSGNGNDFTQVSGTRQPLLNSSDANFNGLPSITFDGDNDVLGNSALLLDNNFSEGVLVIAFKSNDFSTQTVFSFSSSTFRKFTMQVQSISGPFDVIVGWNWVGGGGGGTYNAIEYNSTPIVYTQKYDGSEITSQARISQFINGTELTPVGTSATTPTTISNTETGVYIGNRDGAGALALNGEIAEILYFKSLSPANQIRIENYLIDKYAL